MVAKYGYGLPVEIIISTKIAPKIYLETQDMGLNTTVDVSFIVNNEVAVSLEFVDIDCFITAALTNYTFNIQVLSMNMTEIDTITS